MIAIFGVYDSEGNEVSADQIPEIPGKLEELFEPTETTDRRVVMEFKKPDAGSSLGGGRTSWEIDRVKLLANGKIQIEGELDTVHRFVHNFSTYLVYLKDDGGYYLD